MDRSSESDSKGAGNGAAGEVAWGARGAGKFWATPLEAIGLGAGGGGTSLGTSFTGEGLGFGVSSTVECFPVVHGAIERNSSKVKTRGLQHFHPVALSGVSKRFKENPLKKMAPEHLSALHGRWVAQDDRYNLLPNL